MNVVTEPSSFFERRRRMRRLRMIVELTSNLIRNDRSMSHREARSLVHCAERAILEMLPAYEGKFDLFIRPHFERILRDRWPTEESVVCHAGELVN